MFNIRLITVMLKRIKLITFESVRRIASSGGGCFDYEKFMFESLNLIFSNVFLKTTFSEKNGGYKKRFRKILSEAIP